MNFHTSFLVFFVNGKKVTEKNPDPLFTLLTYLRQKLLLTGTKLGCGEGGCGSCTVMVSKLDRCNGQISHYAANACLLPLCSVHGLAITTVEGIGSTETRLHPIQERLARSHGTQCGFCTPGIIMSMYSLLRNTPQPSRADLERTLEGNLCRCTGYRPILDGFNTFTKEFQHCALGEKCCRNQNLSLDNGPSENSSTLSEPCDPSQEPIFPSELQLSSALDEQALYFKGETVSWYRPVTLVQLLDLKCRFPEAKLVVGNTEIGIEVYLKKMCYPTLVDITHIKELQVTERLDSCVRLGASVTLAHVEDTLKTLVTEIPEHQTKVLTAILEMLRWFAGQQIRNVASIGGNIVTASPVSDLNPVFLSARCILTVMSQAGTRKLCMDETFFTTYRKTQIKPEEILTYIEIPLTDENEYFYAYKQAQRREDDIAIVNAAFKVKFKPGMAPITKMAVNTMKVLKGKVWDDELVSEASSLLASEMSLAPGTPGGMESYRCTLTSSLFFKFYLTVRRQLEIKYPKLYTQPLCNREESATLSFNREPSHGIQVYEEVAEGQEPQDPVWRPYVHLSATKQTTGEAVYLDDIPPYSNELCLALVLSSKAHARILNVDYSAALGMPGVQGHITHEDVPGSNMFGCLIKEDEEVLASKMVYAQGQTIGGILADTKARAQAAARMVEVAYEELDPIITIEQAINAESFMGPQCERVHGDPDGAFKTATHIIEGEVRIGGQEHFYLETNATLAVPKEDGEMEIISGTQSPTACQVRVSDVLGVPSNRIEVKVKRIGGGFGGKETRCALALLPCAVAAHKYQRPVRFVLERDQDMLMTGARHPFLGKYKVAFDDEGRIQALDLILYANGGHSQELTPAVMATALNSIENCYRIPNLRVRSFCCRTNTPSNTAFRAFGMPQSMFITETWITDIAHVLGLEPDRVREVNMNEEGDVTYFGQALTNCTIQRCWSEVLEKSNLPERRRGVAEFNRCNRWKKRGFSLVPTRFPVGFIVSESQAGALVHVYKDGSVLLTHGGVEMGQGVHTKIMQIASRVLQIPMSKIHISETSTQLVPNTSPSAASVTTDLNGMAVINACEKLLERLAPIMAEHPRGSWEEWVSKAYFRRISLSATGFYRTPEIYVNSDGYTGHPYAYFSYGAAYSEVEIDCLTGDHKVLRTDIVMDVGRSLNPAIDIGQIEGAFIQGYGLFTMEEQKMSPAGFLYSNGPGTYKIPTFGDIPSEFNVTLLKNSSNPKAVYSSKAIGEPPLFLSASVFFAIKDAIKSARKEGGLDGRFRLDSPATAERIRMACQDKFTKLLPEVVAESHEQWTVCM